MYTGGSSASFFAELDPFASGTAMIVPIQLWVICENLQAAAHQKEDAK
jgi:hypothetical protein